MAHGILRAMSERGEFVNARFFLVKQSPLLQRVMDCITDLPAGPQEKHLSASKKGSEFLQHATAFGICPIASLDTIARSFSRNGMRCGPPPLVLSRKPSRE